MDTERPDSASLAEPGALDVREDARMETSETTELWKTPLSGKPLLLHEIHDEEGIELRITVTGGELDRGWSLRFEGVQAYQCISGQQELEDDPSALGTFKVQASAWVAALRSFHIHPHVYTENVYRIITATHTVDVMTPDAPEIHEVDIVACCDDDSDEPVS